MRIEPLGDWKFKMTSPEGEEVVVQFGEGSRITYNDPTLDGNTPMSAAELLAKGGQTNMLEGRRITIKERDQMTQYRCGDDGRPTLVESPRSCEFKRKWEGDWEPGKWHAWSTDHEEFETGPGPYPVGIIEDSTGCIHSVYAERIRMEKP